jgi:hypothetical protein
MFRAASPLAFLAPHPSALLGLPVVFLGLGLVAGNAEQLPVCQLVLSASIDADDVVNLVSV